MLEKRCANCGTQVLRIANFCRICGSPLVAEAQIAITKPMFSPPRPHSRRNDVIGFQELHSQAQSWIFDKLAPPTHAIVAGFELAGFNLRLAATMLDTLLLMLVLLLSALPASESLQWLGYVISFVFLLFNYVVLPARGGQTVGKKLLGIKIIPAKLDSSRLGYGRILLRHLVGYPMASLTVLGLLWILWDPRQQGWQDKLADTLVVKAI
ncbi:MAG: RDD family protein [Acidobacteriota bacterium]|nr:RDD family protein [Blastocatellia bacterium]MDW8413707.1 RDD family protein [Acidobacteriota bacterium]